MTERSIGTPLPLLDNGGADWAGEVTIFLPPLCRGKGRSMRRGVTVLFSVVLASGVAAALLVVALVAQTRPAEAAFPGINGRIAFSSDRGHISENDIYTMSFTGESVRRLTSDPIGSSSPAFSPNGKKIAYVGSAGRRTNIYVMDADGSNKRLVTDESKIPGDGKSDFDPSFSPSGRKIVFSRGEGYRAYSLYKINVDGSDFAPVYEGQRLSENPAWSPDGTKIALNYGPNGIATVSPDGTGYDRIGSGYDPDWSPDGTRLTFALDEGSGVEAEIYTMKEDGTERTQLTHPDRPFPLNRTSAGGPVFSPGGGKIAFHDGRDGDGEIFIIDADGTNEKKLTQNQAADFVPAWQPVQ